jgi:hypothetical protein
MTDKKPHTLVFSWKGKLEPGQTSPPIGPALDGLGDGLVLLPGPAAQLRAAAEAAATSVAKYGENSPRAMRAQAALQAKVDAALKASTKAATPAPRLGDSDDQLTGPSTISLSPADRIVAAYVAVSYNNDSSGDPSTESFHLYMNGANVTELVGGSSDGWIITPLRIDVLAVAAPDANNMISAQLGVADLTEQALGFQLFVDVLR